MRGFNLLATCPRGLEQQASLELYGFLVSLGGHPVVVKADPPGVLLVEVNIAYERIVEELRSVLREEPWRIRYLRRLMPLQVVAEDIEALLEGLRPLMIRISATDSFRVTVERRYSTLSSREIIGKIAGMVKGRVDLERPDWIVQVEIVGRLIGASVIRSGVILSVVREKRGF